MKGPYERLKYDLRRLWECPVCKRRERTDGGVTFRHCACRAKEGGQPVVMLLIADGAQRLVPVIAQARGQCGDAAADVRASVDETVKALPAEVLTAKALTSGQGDPQVGGEVAEGASAE